MKLVFHSSTIAMMHSPITLESKKSLKHWKLFINPHVIAQKTRIFINITVRTSNLRNGKNIIGVAQLE